jgi:Protein of unknown function (DUF742)
MSAPKDRWLDQAAGPVVRPYAVTKGRTLPSDGTKVDLIDVVTVTGLRPPEGFRPGPEHRRILRLCRQPSTVVDLASDIDLPAGVVRVLLGDLSDHGMVKIFPARRGRVTDERLLRDVLHGLQAL